MSYLVDAIAFVLCIWPFMHMYGVLKTSSAKIKAVLITTLIIIVLLTSIICHAITSNIYINGVAFVVVVWFCSILFYVIQGQMKDKEERDEFNRFRDNYKL